MLLFTGAGSTSNSLLSPYMETLFKVNVGNVITLEAEVFMAGFIIKRLTRAWFVLIYFILL